MIQIRSLLLVAAAAAVAGSLAVGCNRGATDQASLPAEPPPLSGPESYQKNCQGCHGPKGEGVKDLGPALRKLNVRIPHDDQIAHIIRNGRGKMPGYKQMSDTELKALIAYIRML